MNTPWHLGPLVSFDTETTGINPPTDRIVTAALVMPGRETRTWVADPGVEIPARPAEIHGYTTERARSEGRPAAVVVEEVVAALANEMAGGSALVVMNAPFDLSLLDAECARYGVPMVADRIGRPVGPVIDPLVLDRAADKFRKGKRSLEALCTHYGVTLTDAHTADADAAATLAVSLRIAEEHPTLQVPAEVLHGWQVTWHARWAAGYGAHLSARGNKPVVIDPNWPVRPAVEKASA